jgi:hypothetical protein
VSSARCSRRSDPVSPCCNFVSRFSVRALCSSHRIFFFVVTVDLVFAQYQIEDFSSTQIRSIYRCCFPGFCRRLYASDFSDFRACSAISRSDFPSVHFPPVRFRLRFVPAVSLQSDSWAKCLVRQLISVFPIGDLLLSAVDLGRQLLWPVRPSVRDFFRSCRRCVSRAPVHFP